MSALVTCAHAVLVAIYGVAAINVRQLIRHGASATNGISAIA